MKKKKIIVIILIIIIATAVIGVKYYKDKNSQQVDGIPKDAIPVETEKAHLETIVSTVKADGIVKFKDSTFLYSSSEAEIKKVFVKEGDVIKKGQIVIEYDNEALDNIKNQLSDAQLSLKMAQLNLEKAQLPAEQSELKQYEAQITQSQNRIKEIDYETEQLQISKEQAQNDIDAAQRDYDNLSILFSEGVSTKSELDQAQDRLEETKNNLKKIESQYNAQLLSVETEKSNIELAQTQYDNLKNKINLESTQKEIQTQKIEIEQAQLKIKQLNDEIKKFKLQETAPCDGTIVRLEAKDGEKSVEGKELMEIADINNIIISVDIPEYDMSEIQLGQEAFITSEALSEGFNGTITKIYPIAEEKTINGSAKTVVTVEITAQSDQILKSGYTVDAQITTKVSENVVVVPIMAYATEKDGSAYVYVVNDDYTFEKRPVKLKAYSDLNVEVEGVENGETVITNPDESLQTALYVRPNNLDENSIEISSESLTENSSESLTE